MSENELSSLSKLIPKLTGTDSFIRWNRTIRAYLLDKGALRVLEGREKEPYRREVDPTVLGDRAVVRPAGEYAGAEMPSGPVIGGLQNVTANTTWTAAQSGKWEEKERKARSTIILTVSPGMAAKIENMWSACDMYEHIKAEHKIDTIKHRGNLLWRIQSLRLPSGASADQMNEHYESFTSLAAEAISAGIHLKDWDKCKRFLVSLDNDFETLRLQLRLMPAVDRTWRNIVTIYKSLADTRRMKQERDATVAAIFKSGPSSNLSKAEKGNKEGGRPKKGKGQTGKGKNDDGKGTTCSWCGYRNHTEPKCRKKASGEPSKAAKRHKEKGSVTIRRLSSDHFGLLRLASLRH